MSFIANDCEIGETFFLRVNLIKDLRILHDSSLKFYDHLDMANFKANNTLGFIMRNIKEFKNKDAIIYLYKTTLKIIF